MSDLEILQEIYGDLKHWTVEELDLQFRLIALARKESKIITSWIDELKVGDRILFDGDSATIFSITRQQPSAPDYFQLDFDDGSYIGVSDNELIGRGTLKEKTP